ncbi:hypothetical protein MKW92_011181 [Papaver armeniacum]|nr:hypothetical protein MKW92_011181 [Papaver armeniacum]
MVLIKKKGKKRGGSRRKNRISELPEHLIHLILSFLPTQCVVCMSVLSKRWRYIWTSIPVIDLRGFEFPKIVKLEKTIEEAERVKNLHKLQDQSFMNFFDKKLSLHHNRETGDVKKFYLDTRNRIYPEPEKLKEWLSALFTRHNLEEFVFYAENSPDDGFFPSTGTYASLTILDLDTWDPVYLPDAVNFPNLKICKLMHADLYMYSDDPAQQFFSNLPVLEELELTDCQYWNMSYQLIISAPSLKYLSIIGPRESTTFDDDFPIYGFTINIFAPNLQFLRYMDVSADDYILHRFESLVDAEIDFDRCDTDIPMPQEIVPITTKVLKELYNIKHLTISGATFKELLFPDDLFTNWPTFHNLVHLEFTSKISFSKNKNLLNFLRISPNLKTIVFAQGFVGDLPSIGSGWTPDMVPQCILLHLKLVKFCEFYGSLEELNAVKTFLKNARVLQKMVIKLSTNEQNKVMKKLLKYPRGSPSCIIQVL